jgi:hypothetical protein
MGVITTLIKPPLARFAPEGNSPSTTHLQCVHILTATLTISLYKCTYIKCASYTDNELTTPAPLYFTNLKKIHKKLYPFSICIYIYIYIYIYIWRTHALSVVHVRFDLNRYIVQL